VRMPKMLAKWPEEEARNIAQFQDIPVRVKGYILKIRPQTGNTETTNCNSKKALDTDWHIAFVDRPGRPEGTSVVVEVTPRIRVAHPGWTRRRLAPWTNTPLPVRITGWLMYDPEHANHLGRFRGTLWEVHPITRIEVSLDGEWVDLDTLSATEK